MRPFQYRAFLRRVLGRIYEGAMKINQDFLWGAG